MRGSTHILVATVATLLAGCAGAQYAGQQVEDKVLTARVESRLAMDPDASSIDVDVDTIQGIVTLRGEVPSPTEKAVAEDVTRYTPGVLGVRNLLVVEDQTMREGMGEGLSDAWIRTKVGARLTSDPDVRRFRIDADVDDGVVTLSGTVASSEARQAAEDVARRTEGVKRVVNELLVAQPPTPAPVVESGEP